MESLRVTIPEIWPGQNLGGKKEKKNNEANWMVSNSAQLDRRTKQHTQFGVSASNGSRDMGRTKSWQEKKKKKKKKKIKKKNEHPQSHIASPTGIANNNNNNNDDDDDNNSNNLFYLSIYLGRFPQSGG